MIDEIISRRSIRKFTDEKIEKETILKILECARWAPSGLNNQPWEFIVIESENKNRLAKYTKYNQIILTAPVCIAVYYNEDRGYNRVKDIQGVSAAMQNMLLAIHMMGLGGVWLGEILNQQEEVNKLLEAPDNVEFMGVIAFGNFPKDLEFSKRSRYPLSKIVHKEKFGNTYLENDK
jgi:nitroreductase